MPTHGRSCPHTVPKAALRSCGSAKGQLSGKDGGDQMPRVSQRLQVGYSYADIVSSCYRRLDYIIAFHAHS